MYTKEQASQLRLAFWTAYGHYMAPVPSAEGYKVNWSNYKTGIKHVNFRLQADQKKASIAIELTHLDTGLQELYFQQFEELKGLLHQSLGEEWEWALHTSNEHGKTISRIFREVSPVNLFSKEDWPALISFFKPRIMALDVFWRDARYTFEELK
jgi:hypothetical protein